MRYNPYKLFVGSFIPNWLLERPELSSNAKLVFARLAQYAGETGEAFPFQKTLCRDVGLPDSTTRRALKELVDAKLVESQQNGLGKSNSYFFVKHAWMSAPAVVQSDRSGMLASEQTGMPGFEQTGRSPVSKLNEENQGRESGKRDGKSKHFVKPELAEMVSYGIEIGLPSWDVSAFSDHHEARDWKLGREKMKDWKAAMRTWKRNAEKFAKPNHGAARAAAVNSDSVWQGDIWLLCDERKREEKHDPAHVRKKFTKALQYADPIKLADYIVSQIGQIPDYWYQIILELSPGKGKRAA